MDNSSQEPVRLSVAEARTLTRAANALLSLQKPVRLIHEEGCLIGIGQ
jgi:hypothetical protein